MSDFEMYLPFGQIAEGYIAAWLRRVCRYTVLPAYEIEIHRGKGPRLLTPTVELIAPDMLAVRGGEVKWIEAKHKSVFSWHRKSQRWVTGIDLRHYDDYQKVAERTEWPVWLLFLHQRSNTKEGSGVCPIGLFGGELSALAKAENHRSDRWGNGGMVYWAHETLKLLATLDEVRAAAMRSQARLIS